MHEEEPSRSAQSAQPRFSRPPRKRGTVRAVTPERAELARWLFECTGGRPVRELENAFPNSPGKGQWNELLNGRRLVSRDLLDSVITSLVPLGERQRMRRRGERLLAAAEAADRANSNSDAPAVFPRPASEPLPGAARSQAQPADLRMSRRRVLTALSFAGVAAGGGTWALWPKEARSGADSNKPPFELPSGKMRIDAVMPVPPAKPHQVVSDYWLFTEDRYLRVRISSTADAKYPVYEVLKPPTKLSEWGKTIGAVKGFQEGIDAVLHVPEEPNQYWVFSKDQYIRIELSPEDRYADKMISDPIPNSISDWAEAFKGFTSIDAVMPVPGSENKAWVFSGNNYVLIRLHGKGKAGGTTEVHQSISGGWEGSIGSQEGFSTGIDAAIPVPGEPKQYWVFSGKKYMKINVSMNDNYSDSVLRPPSTLRTEST